MPRKIEERLVEIGGFKTDFGREEFLKNAAKRRDEIMADMPQYRDLTKAVMSAEYAGSLSKPAAGFSSRNSKPKGNKMPKSTKIVSATTVAGKRGRKSEFKPADWQFEIGEENALDVTEEMLSGIDKYLADNSDADFSADDLWTNDNADAKKYRNSRFGAFKRVAILANGKDSKYDLADAMDENNDRIWALVRKA